MVTVNPNVDYASVVALIVILDGMAGEAGVVLAGKGVEVYCGVVIVRGLGNFGPWCLLGFALRIMPVRRQGMTTDAIEELIAQHVANALETYETNRNTRNGNGNRSGSQSDGRSGSRRTTVGHEAAYEMSLKDLMKMMTEANCLRNEIQKLESEFWMVLDKADKVERTVGHDAAYEMSWKDLIKMMTKAYCPRNEIQKLQTELCNLTVKGTNVVGYTQHFQELALMCPRMVFEEEDKVESLMDQKVRAYAARQAKNKRRMDNNPRDNHAQQPPYKR
nr:reverse transcriptase domain-containing protein [Tanacetum cinerariifolium]